MSITEETMKKLDYFTKSKESGIYNPSIVQEIFNNMAKLGEMKYEKDLDNESYKEYVEAIPVNPHMFSLSKDSLISQDARIFNPEDYVSTMEETKGRSLAA